MTQQMNNANGFVQLVKGLMGVFMTSDGERVSSSKVYLGFLLMFLIAVYQNRDGIVDFFSDIHKNSSIVTYIEQEEKERVKHLDASIVNQSQAIYSVLRPDTVGVYMYRPDDLHHFKELIHFEGVLPSGTDESDYKKMGIDKSSKQYQNHIMGVPHMTDGVVKFEPSYKTERFSYTCPIFNRRNMYVGYVGMHWKEVPKIEELRFFSACFQASREIGLQIK